MQGYLETKLYYNRLVDYVDLTTGKIHLCLPTVYNYQIPKGHSLEFSGDDMNDVLSIINTLTRVPYDKDQSNPLEVFDAGGNCQAISLLTKAYLDNADIKNILVTEPTHMYNIVYIDGDTYVLDIVNNIFREGVYDE